MRNNSTEPEIVMRNGKAVAVILDIEDYQELLEKAEDVESLRILEKLRQEPLEFRLWERIERLRARMVERDSGWTDEEIAADIEEERLS